MSETTDAEPDPGKGAGNEAGASAPATSGDETLAEVTGAVSESGGSRWRRRLLNLIPGVVRARRHRSRWVALVIVVAHVLGALTSVHAVMSTRTPQGAVAWAVSLNTMPYVAVPAYWIFGRVKFRGYVNARREDLVEARPVAERLRAAFASVAVPAEEKTRAMATLEKLASLPYSRGNDVTLLVDGEETFESIFEAIDAAQEYVLVQFYIVRDDGLGRQLRDRLAAKAAAGVKVYFLYDEIGSHQLPRSYLQELSAAGARVSAFHSTRGEANRFQINFRNHRKIVVCDGEVGFVGGHNVGDEYLGLDPKMSPWRDTHVRVSGPAVACLQIPFAEDWHWATDELLVDLDWELEAAPGGEMEALCLPTGPADPVETCTMFFLTAIHEARERLWIASPYFVPDEQIVTALQLAALRGVDVRILIPENPDSNLVYWSSFTYLPEMETAGVRVYRYLPGFLHQKVILMDDAFAGVGTANFDNRSFRLNFEVTLAVEDKGFAAEVEEMLEEDFSRSREVFAKELTDRSFLFQLRSRIARLMAPVQ